MIDSVYCVDLYEKNECDANVRAVCAFSCAGCDHSSLPTVAPAQLFTFSPSSTPADMILTLYNIPNTGGEAIATRVGTMLRQPLAQTSVGLLTSLDLNRACAIFERVTQGYEGEIRRRSVSSTTFSRLAPVVNGLWNDLSRHDRAELAGGPAAIQMPAVLYAYATSLAAGMSGYTLITDAQPTARFTVAMVNPSQQQYWSDAGCGSNQLDMQTGELYCGSGSSTNGMTTSNLRVAELASAFTLSPTHVAVFVALSEMDTLFLASAASIALYTVISQTLTVSVIGTADTVTSQSFVNGGGVTVVIRDQSTFNGTADATALRCARWVHSGESLGSWSTDGCAFSGREYSPRGYMTSCFCNSLSTYAVVEVSPAVFQVSAPPLSAPTPAAPSGVGILTPTPVPSVMDDVSEIDMSAVQSVVYGVAKADFSSVVFLGMGVVFTVLMTQMIVLAISYFKTRHTLIHYAAVSRMIHAHQAFATFMTLLSVFVSNQIATSAYESETPDCRVTGIVLHFFALLTLAWGVARAWHVLQEREPDEDPPDEGNIKRLVYGVTIVFMAIVAAALHENYRSDSSTGKVCFISTTGDAELWLLYVVPAAMLVLLGLYYWYRVIMAVPQHRAESLHADTCWHTATELPYFVLLSIIWLGVFPFIASANNSSTVEYIFGVASIAASINLLIIVVFPETQSAHTYQDNSVRSAQSPSGAGNGGYGLSGDHLPVAAPVAEVPLPRAESDASRSGFGFGGAAQQATAGHTPHNLPQQHQSGLNAGNTRHNHNRQAAVTIVAPAPPPQETQQLFGGIPEPAWQMATPSPRTNDQLAPLRTMMHTPAFMSQGRQPSMLARQSASRAQTPMSTTPSAWSQDPGKWDQPPARSQIVSSVWPATLSHSSTPRSVTGVPWSEVKARVNSATPTTHWTNVRTMAKELLRDSHALHAATKDKTTGIGKDPASLRSHVEATLAESASWASEGAVLPTRGHTDHSVRVGIGTIRPPSWQPGPEWITEGSLVPTIFPEATPVRDPTEKQAWPMTPTDAGVSLPNSFLAFAHDVGTPAPGETTAVSYPLPGATFDSAVGNEVTQSFNLHGQPLCLSVASDNMGNVRVSEIGKGSPIARNGRIGRGDRIIRVSGIDVSRSSIDEVAAALYQSVQADRLDLTVLRDSSHV